MSVACVVGIAVGEKTDPVKGLAIGVACGSVTWGGLEVLAWIYRHLAYVLAAGAILAAALGTAVATNPHCLEPPTPGDEEEQALCLALSVFAPSLQPMADVKYDLVPIEYGSDYAEARTILHRAAASAQGLQNLSPGLRHRHYVPAAFGQRNRFDVADRPVYAQVLVVAICFLLFGTHEETYLELYAAGVFVLLGLTGWAAVRRLSREFRTHISVSRGLGLTATVLAALLTSGAAGLIFFERFSEGAWTYLVLVPLLFLGFSYHRNRIGEPIPVTERLGRVIAEQRTSAPPSSLEWPRSILAAIGGASRSEAGLIEAKAPGGRLGVS